MQTYEKIIFYLIGSERKKTTKNGTQLHTVVLNIEDVSTLGAASAMALLQWHIEIIHLEVE
jgi:hypothetical protein